MKTRLHACLLVFLTFSLASIVRAQSSVYTGTCDVSQISYVTTDAVSGSHVSKTFADVPNTVLNFIANVGGCIKVDVATTVASESQAPVTLRVVLDTDTKVVIVPSQVVVVPTPAGRHFKASFILPVEDGFGSGNHNLRLQWKSASNDIVLSSKTSLVAYHN